MSDFVNRKKELKKLYENIEKDVRVNIIYSLKGRGKSSMIAHAFESMNDIYYINVSSEELLGKVYAEDYFFIKLIAEELCNTLPLSFVKKMGTKLGRSSTNISFSLSAFFAGIGFDSPKRYKVLQSSIIKSVKGINKNIFIHIENMQKIDSPSLKFLAKLVNETTNVFLCLEYIIEKNNSMIIDSSAVYLKFNISPKYIELNSLEWAHVCNIFENLKLDIDEDLKQEYLSLNGDIKTLIFNHENQVIENIELNQDEHFLVNFVMLTSAELDRNKIYQILQNYEKSYFKYALGRLQNIINGMINKELISEIAGHLYVTKIGLKYADTKYTILATEILATYYIPIIESHQKLISKEIIKGIKILVPLLVKNNDGRIKKIVPYIKTYLLPLNYNKNIIDNLFACINNVSQNEELFFCLINIYISLGCYNDVLPKLEENYIKNPKYNILHAIALIHVRPEKTITEKIIKKYIHNEVDNEYISSLYTCLIALYMKTKPSEFVINFVREIYNSNLITIQDQKVINKNISIYYDYSEAVDTIKDSIKYFKHHNMIRFAIASYITLATRYAQNGNLDRGKRILELLEKSIYLSEEDLVYIDNNLANIEIYSGNITEKTYDSLMNAYVFLDDEYTKMLSVNNLLVYYTLVKDFSSAQIYVSKIEDIGFERYKFDEYLHLSYMNLLFYYTSISDNTNITKYIDKLEQLKVNCQSLELKKFIDKTTNNCSLNQTDKWFFMSQFNFRTAYMGHWMISSFDY